MNGFCRAYKRYSLVFYKVLSLDDKTLFLFAAILSVGILAYNLCVILIQTAIWERIQADCLLDLT